MSTVSRYLLREFLSASAAVMLALAVTWVAADTLLHIDEIGDGTLALLQTALDRLLEVLPLGVPVACVVGAVLSITSAVRSREITAIRCGGIPLRSALAPILVACVLIATGLAFFEDRVIMKTRQARIEAEAGREADGPRLERRNGRYWYAAGASIFVANDYDPESRTLRDVTVFQLSPSRAIQQHIEAESAVYLSEQSWELRNAIVREFGGPGLSQRQVSALRMDLGLTGADLERAELPLETETLHGLAERIQDKPAGGEERIALEASFHGRLAQPLAVLILVLLAIPFAVGDVERGDSLPRALLSAMIATAGFWVAWALGLLTARAGWVPPAFPVWGVVLLALAIGTWRFRAVRE